MCKRTVVSASFATVILVCLGLAVHASDDIDAHRHCTNCGMDRKAYGFSRMLLRFDNGTEVGVCSLHCAAVEMESKKDSKPGSILVADRDTRTLIRAEQAVWVAGGNKRGVMTDHPSWAFSTKASADTFISEYGGRLATWQDVLAEAQKEISSGNP